MNMRLSKMVSAIIVIVTATLIVALPALPASSSPPTPTPPIVTPELIEGTVHPGESEYDTINVSLPEKLPKGDVAFVFDATGSMRWVIATVQANATAMMGGIRAAIPDTAFGVGSFTDYPHSYTSYWGYTATYGGSGDYAWHQDQDITTNTTLVASKIGAIVYGGGADGPQDYTRIAWETMNYSWRPGAKKIVVLFGDAPPHSAPSGLTLRWPDGTLVFSSAYGGDPGPDELMNTTDDLDYGPVVNQVASQYITFVSVDCQPCTGPGYCADAHNNLRYLVNKTGGTVFPYTAINITDDIIDRIEAMAIAPIGNLTLVPDPTFASWVAWTPSKYTNVSWGTNITFDVNITVPLSTSAGDYNFSIDVVADGVTLGTVNVTKHVLPPIMVGNVTGGGWIPIATPPPSKGKPQKEGKATFGFVAHYVDGATIPSGNLQYTDHVSGMSVHGNVTTLSVDKKTMTAIFSGTAKVDGVDGYAYTVTVVDNGEPGKNDIFGINIPAKSYAANGTLGGGNIQIHDP